MEPAKQTKGGAGYNGPSHDLSLHEKGQSRIASVALLCFYLKIAVG